MGSARAHVLHARGMHEHPIVCSAGTRDPNEVEFLMNKKSSGAPCLAWLVKHPDGHSVVMFQVARVGGAVQNVIASDISLCRLNICVWTR